MINKYFQKFLYHASYQLRRLVVEIAWALDPVHWMSARKIKKLKDKHKGERCFIIGNGPSLNRMDLSLLKNETTIGLNRIYLLFERMGFPTTYLVCVNKLVLEQWRNDFNSLPITKFISRKARDYIDFSENTIFIDTLYTGNLDFSTNISNKIHEGSTVTYVAMQIAYNLGFETVILIGVDHNFQTKGEPHKTLISDKPDANHFDPNYFGKGFKWQLPDLVTSEKAYGLAKKYFEADGRKILDATVNGKLEIFEKIDYYSLFT